MKILRDLIRTGALRRLALHLCKKTGIQSHRSVRSRREVKKNAQFSHEQHVTDRALVAMEQMELYYQAHPGSPAAVRRPKLLVRGDLWIALLGPTVEEGIVGIGPSVTAALRAFDAQYLAGLRPPAEVIRKDGKGHNAILHGGHLIV